MAKAASTQRVAEETFEEIHAAAIQQDLEAALSAAP
jgi:hypothetical protein